MLLTVDEPYLDLGLGKKRLYLFRILGIYTLLNGCYTACPVHGTRIQIHDTQLL